jgi:ABC-type Mn2+/Zn2+ transport system permease subunit
MIDALTGPWSEPIMRHALLEMLFVGASCGALGVWIVLYGLSYGAESLAHSMFPGLAVAALVGLPLALGGAAGLAVAGVAIALAGRVRGVGPDNAVAVVVTSLFGLGALLALSPDSPPGLQSLLFGDVLGASDADLALAGALAAVVLGGMWLSHWRFLAAGFDRAGARAVGVSALGAELALMVLLAVAVLVGVQGLGNLLVVAVLVAPAATARTLTRRLGPMIALAAAIGVAGGVAGLYLSYYVNVATGAAIAGILVLAYLIARARPSRVPRAGRAPAAPPAPARTAAGGR